MTPDGEESKDLTFGEKAVGLTFNPSNNEVVETIKRSFAGIVDHLNSLRENTSDGEVRRMLSVAITEAQSAQMWAVKAVTWQ